MLGAFRKSTLRWEASSLSGPGIFGEGAAGAVPTNQLQAHAASGSEEPQQGNLSDLPRLLEETGGA